MGLPWFGTWRLVKTTTFPFFPLIFFYRSPLVTFRGASRWILLSPDRTRSAVSYGSEFCFYRIIIWFMRSTSSSVYIVFYVSFVTNKKKQSTGTCFLFKLYLYRKCHLDQISVRNRPEIRLQVRGRRVSRTKQSPHTWSNKHRWLLHVVLCFHHFFYFLAFLRFVPVGVFSSRFQRSFHVGRFWFIKSLCLCPPTPHMCILKTLKFDTSLPLYAMKCISVYMSVLRRGSIN